MRNFNIYLSILVCLFVSELFAQKTFYDRVKEITFEIDKVTKEEKLALKNEVEQINAQFDTGTISDTQAQEKKKAFATIRANNIETRVAQLEGELKELMQQRIDGKIKDPEYLNDTIWINGRGYVQTDVRNKKGKSFSFSFKKGKIHDSISQRRTEPRTTSQFVFATGLNNLVTNGAVANSDFRYFGSHFYEWGIAWNRRINKEHNLLHLRYGLSVMYNNLRPTENRMFVDQGEQTQLQVSEKHLNESRFRNVYLVLPLHLEFDFTPTRTYNDQKVFKTHQSFKVGIGGYAGFNVKSKQILKTDSDGYKNRSVTKGNFNVNDFIYGVSAYVGYKETSLYVKYDLNPLFKNNAVDQNNVSLGVRFDLN